MPSNSEVTIYKKTVEVLDPATIDNKIDDLLNKSRTQETNRKTSTSSAEMMDTCDEIDCIVPLFPDSRRNLQSDAELVKIQCGRLSLGYHTSFHSHKSMLMS